MLAAAAAGCDTISLRDLPIPYPYVIYLISLRDVPCDMPLLPVIYRQTLWYIGSATRSRGGANCTRSAYIPLYTMNRLGIYQRFRFYFRINSARPKKKYKSKTQLGNEGAR